MHYRYGFLDEPEIIEDKEVEITIALGVGLLILILDRRADRNIHEIIHQQHILVNQMHKKIDEQNELIKNLQKISSSSYLVYTANKNMSMVSGGKEDNNLYL